MDALPQKNLAVIPAAPSQNPSMGDLKVTPQEGRTKKHGKSNKSKRAKKSNKKAVTESSSESTEDSDPEGDSDNDSTDLEVPEPQRRIPKNTHKSKSKKTQSAKKPKKRKGKGKPVSASASDSDSDSDSDSSASALSDVVPAVSKGQRKHQDSLATDQLASQLQLRQMLMEQQHRQQQQQQQQQQPQQQQTYVYPNRAAPPLGLIPGFDQETMTVPNPYLGGARRAMRARLPAQQNIGLGGFNPTLAQQKANDPSKLDYKRVDQVWDSTIHNFKLQDTTKTESIDAKYGGFVFHVRRTFDFEGKYKATLVDIKSKFLRECLKDVIGDIKKVSFVEDIPKVDPNLLFLYLEDLRKYLKILKTTKADRKKEQRHIDTKRQHLKVLVKYVDKDYDDVKKSIYPMLENGLITFDLLWALWKPNTLAFTTTYGATDVPRVFKVEAAEKHYNMMKGELYHLEGKYFEYDGKQFGYGTLAEETPEFRGARKITSLNCYPLKYHKNEAKLRQQLIERGKKFVTLSGVHYKCHAGLAFYKKKKSIIKVNVNGRVMCDANLHRRINPNYPISLVRPKDQDVLSDGEDSENESDCGAAHSDLENGGGNELELEEGEEKIKYVTKVFKDDKGRQKLLRMTKEEAAEASKEKLGQIPSTDHDDAAIASEGDDSQPKGDKKTPVFTEDEYLMASPVVLGFAFGEKLWLEFTVSGIKEIQWNENAYESLVLPPKIKETVKSLVESHRFHGAESIDDVIQGKGKGLVAVLHGPPGTGKTLTAEGISELIKCPLYMVSAGELGTDSRFLEIELQKILDVCHSWGAILLLDEADVFLEKRSMHEIQRNALVSIFLRLLEYFQGILFLTTNRVETFDDAFQSRIHIALRYDPLDPKARKAVFKMFVERARIQQKSDKMPFSDEDYNTLARYDLNGRQIKNTVVRAQALAVHKGEPLNMEHVRLILDVQINFQRDLAGGSGYQDAMRSYF